MKIEIQVTGDEELLRKLNSLNKQRLRYWIMFGEQKASKDFADYVRSDWLSGQALNATPASDVWTSLKTRATRKTRVVSIRPGVGIPGRLNYLARWDQASGHEFMVPAWKRWHGVAKVTQRVDENIDYMLTEVFKE